MDMKTKLFRHFQIKKKKWNNFAYEGEWGQFCKPREFQISRAFKLLRDKLCVLIRKI